MPGERVSCIGCHEDRNKVAIPRNSIASRKKPQEIIPFYGKKRGFSFRHEVQPVLDKYCIGCHNENKTNIPCFKGDKMITDWDSQISGKAGTEYGGHFSESYVQLHRYVRRPGIESDIQTLTPMDVHADQTELMQILNKGHHNVQLNKESLEKLACWIDFNAPFHGRRSDISNYCDAEKSVCLKKKYGKLYGAPDIDHEWLPEIPSDIETIMPKKVANNTTKVKNPDGWPINDDKTFKRQLALQHIRMSVPVNDNVNIEMVKIPHGEFVMGSNNHPDEMPKSVVEIDKPFWIGRFEITNEQYKQFKADHDSRHEHRHGYQFGREGYPLNKPNQPVVRISWEEAMAFCEWLSDKTGKKFTLPTESQWEWACRAGTETPFWFGNADSDFTNYANLGDIKLKEFAACTAHKFYESVRIIDNPTRYDDWIPRNDTYNDGGFISEEPGRYRGNRWDLFDMHGNVWEWTRSSYKPYPYNGIDGRNAPVKEDKIVARGGSWYDRPYRATSSFRLPYRQYQKVYNVGFRVVMEE
jgi:formylglycine-generating enzyme required for sulfatase activity